MSKVARRKKQGSLESSEDAAGFEVDGGAQQRVNCLAAWKLLSKVVSWIAMIYLSFFKRYFFATKI